MKLENITIKNFRSIKDSGTINLKSNPLIIVGKNNAGKSNLFKSIQSFIKGLRNSTSEDIKSYKSEFFNNMTNEIQICCFCQLNKGEFEEVFKNHVNDIIRHSDNKVPIIEITVGYKHENSRVTFGIKSLKIGNFNILKSDYNLLEYTPLDNLGKGTFTGTIEIPDFIVNLIKLLKDKFYFIPSIRYILNEDIIKPITETNIIQGTSIKRFLNDIKNDKDLESKYNNIVDEFKNFEEFDKLYSNRDKSLFEIYSGKYKIENQGDGFSQSLIILAYLIVKENHIFLIEEPEVHLHNFLQRKFIEILKKYKDNNQILITTHSPIFCSSFDTQNVMIAKKINTETKYSSYSNDDDLIKNIYYELGIHLSDFFVADNLCFVEGINDEKVFSKLLNLFGYEYNTIRFINSETWTKLKLHANLKALDNKIKCWFIFDGDTNYLKKEKKDTLDEIGVKGFSKNIFTLKNLDLESYFLVPKLISSFEKNGFKINLSIDEIQKIIDSNKGKKGKIIFEKIFEESDFKSYHDDYVDIVESLNKSNFKENILDIENLQEIFSKILTPSKK
jgi:predicted ATP-dependent endonuclease of OLD family